ncbi:molybdopterin cofactor-binding domain-containing protein [Spirosoma soli]|uniref:Molybdopterin cofactor-binding domain-containing protein n=1 Tax=Spirosoma soli TaxID=1770529 RepID=A0ABW5M0W6_9BACT
MKNRRLETEAASLAQNGLKTGLSRRDFIRASSVAGLGLVVSLQLVSNPAKATPTEITFEPNLYLKLTNTGKIIILAKNPEIGQGVMTSLPMIIAEELDVDWQSIEVQQAPLDSGYGEQSAAGSYAIKNNYDQLRKAGAAAREILTEVAAKRWNVPLNECYTRQGYVYRKGSDQRFRYAELVDETIKKVINPDFPRLKNPADFSIIGKPIPGVENPKLVTGKAVFGIDARPKGALVAVIERCPVFEGTVKRFDATAALKVEGVLQVIDISTTQKNLTLVGVAIVATNTWAALKAKKVLQVEWDFREGETESDQTIQQKTNDLFQKVPDSHRRNDGNVEQALVASKNVCETVLEVPYLAHATLEPMNYVADVRADRAELIGPTQSPDAIRTRAAQITGLPINQITVTMTRVGGGFGRRLEIDYALEAIHLSKTIGKPVQVVWTREDDLRHDFYNPTARFSGKAGLDETGRLTAWHAKTTGMYWPDSFPAGLIPNYRVDGHWVQTKIPIGAWRGPGHNVTAFFNQSLLDELAYLAGKDPVTFQLELLGDDNKVFAQNSYGNKLVSTERMRNVINLVADKAGWFQPAPPNRYRGFAAHYTMGSYAAEIVTISRPTVDSIKIESVVAAADCGRVINSSGAAAQLEGGIIDGLSVALNSAIHIDGGSVRETNFHEYKIMRFPEAPATIEVHFVPSQEHPTGLGEIGLPPAIPALCNAIYAATSKRIRKLPVDFTR